MGGLEGIGVNAFLCVFIASEDIGDTLTDGVEELCSGVVGYCQVEQQSAVAAVDSLQSEGRLVCAFGVGETILPLERSAREDTVCCGSAVVDSEIEVDDAVAVE